MKKETDPNLRHNNDDTRKKHHGIVRWEASWGTYVRNPYVKLRHAKVVRDAKAALDQPSGDTPELTFSPDAVQRMADVLAYQMKATVDSQVLQSVTRYK